MTTSSRRIRVLHVGKFYAPVEGGIENVVRELVTGFRDDPEISADVLVAQRKGPGSVDRLDGATVHRVRSHGVLLSMPLAPRLPAEIVRLGRKYDIVHVHVPNPLAFHCDWRRFESFGARLIVHFHSDIVRPSQRLALRLMQRQERRFYEAASTVLVSSHNLLRHTEALQPYRHKCTVVPLSIDLQSIEPACRDARARRRAELGFRDTDVVFFFLGRLVYYKGVHDLLRAAARCGAKVMVGGAGPLLPDLKALAGKLGIEENVIFLGKVPQAQLSSTYQAADVFVLPSNAASEAFGVVQLEAMAHGLPVINTQLPTGVPEVSQAGQTGLTVLPGDVQALACAMQTLAQDGSLRRQYGSAALHRVQSYAQPLIMESLRQTYRTVMDLPMKAVVADKETPAHSSPGVAPRPLGT